MRTSRSRSTSRPTIEGINVALLIGNRHLRSLFVADGQGTVRGMSDNPRATLPRLVSAVRNLLRRKARTAAEQARDAGFAANDSSPCPYVERPLVQAFWAGREAKREWLD